MNILVTGGAGYIGSHTIVELLQDGHQVTVVDNLCNSSAESLKRVEEITGKSVAFHELDVCDRAALDAIFVANRFDAVIHFAGLKAVGESVKYPLEYYRTNIDSTLSLCEVMAKHGVFTLLFSSSAVVYGIPEQLPVTEASPVGRGITNPYGQSKYMIEQILTDLSVSDERWNITLLRYFNPVGAHESGRIGEDPNGIPNNLMPIITQVVVGRLPKLTVLGNDYDTPDGTALRDYIHVVDLAKGHTAALNKPAAPGTVAIYNLSTGKGTSVLEMVAATEKASGKKVTYEIGPRRQGDIAALYADASKAANELGWRATKTIEQSCQDAWNWQSQNPHGFHTEG